MELHLLANLPWKSTLNMLEGLARHGVLEKWCPKGCPFFLKKTLSKNPVPNSTFNKQSAFRCFCQVWGLMYANVRGKDLKLYVWMETQLVSGKDCAAMTDEHLAVTSAWIKCHSVYSHYTNHLPPCLQWMESANDSLFIWCPRLLGCLGTFEDILFQITFCNSFPCFWFSEKNCF